MTIMLRPVSGFKRYIQFLYKYFGFHRRMFGRFTKALLGTMAGMSSGTFQKSMYCIYVYTMCGLISLSSKQVRLQQGDTNF